jgi:hypothetical protein
MQFSFLAAASLLLAPIVLALDKPLNIEVTQAATVSQLTLL